VRVSSTIRRASDSQLEYSWRLPDCSIKDAKSLQQEEVGHFDFATGAWLWW
jgi:hypothetical protein